MVRSMPRHTPPHPGETILQEFLKPKHLTQRELANAIHAHYQRVNELVNGQRYINPRTALRLAKFFGTTPDYWMNLQTQWDLYHAADQDKAVLKKIRTYKPTA